MWADLLSPGRRALLGGGAAALAALGLARGAQAQTVPVAAPASAMPGRSPWGYETYKEPTPRPKSVRPGEAVLPSTPRAYTDIKSYHAHVYFDEDSHAKAALIRKWAAERFSVELGNWNLEPRRPSISASPTICCR